MLLCPSAGDSCAVIVGSGRLNGQRQNIPFHRLHVGRRRLFSEHHRRQARYRQHGRARPRRAGCHKYRRAGGKLPDRRLRRGGRRHVHRSRRTRHRGRASTRPHAAHLHDLHGSSPQRLLGPVRRWSTAAARTSRATSTDSTTSTSTRPGPASIKPIFPPQSLDFGFSATAMHWTSGLPGRISDHVHAVGAEGEELEIFRRFARADWETILLNRSRELKSGRAPRHE